LDTSRAIASGEIDFDELKKTDYQETFYLTHFPF